MNQLQRNFVSRRILEAFLGSISGSLKPPISSFEVRCFSSAFNGGGGGDGGEIPSPIPGRPLRRNRSSDPPQDDNFLDKFKLGVDSPKNNDDRTTETLHRGSEKPSLRPPSPPPPTPPPPPPRPENSDEIFKKMKETGLIPNAVAMLDGLCKDGLVQEAMKLFGQMREKGTIPEVVVYTAVVDGYCKAQKLDEAVRIFRKMQSNGITPNAFSYNLLVRGLCSDNRSEEGVVFCVEMLESGHSPNVASFVDLVQGLCREKGVEEAKAIVKKLREKGFVLNEKAVREFLDKNSGFSPEVWEAVFGRSEQRMF